MSEDIGPSSPTPTPMEQEQAEGEIENIEPQSASYEEPPTGNGETYVKQEEEELNGQLSSPQSPVHEPGEPSSYPMEMTAPVSPLYHSNPVSPVNDENYDSYIKQESTSQNVSEQSDNEMEEEGDAEEKKADKLNKLKVLQFSRANKTSVRPRTKEKVYSVDSEPTYADVNSPSAPPRRTVRSFLDEKGAEEPDVTAYAARDVKSELREDPTKSDERPEKKKKKKRHDNERERERDKEKERDRERDRERERQPPICFDSRPHPYNPHSIAIKVHSLIARVDAVNAVEGDPTNEEDIADILFETIALETELEEIQEKRATLLTEMEKMFEQEKENIKKIYSEMPPHLQSAVNIDEETLAFINGTNNGTGPPGKFPAMPSLLGADYELGLLTSNGIPNFPLPGINGNRTPQHPTLRAADAGEAEGTSPEYREEGGPRTPAPPPANQISWSAAPLFNPTFGGSQNTNSDSVDGTSGLNIENAIYIENPEAMNITFAFPPISEYNENNTDGDDPMGSYQMPPNPGVAGQNPAKNLNTMMMRLFAKNTPAEPSQNPQQPQVNGSPSQAQGTPSAVPTSLMSNASGGVSSPAKTDSRPNPPSLMSLSLDPHPSFRGVGGASSSAQQRGRSGLAGGHVESPSI